MNHEHHYDQSAATEPLTIRRGRFDPSRIHEAAELYLSGLALVEIGF